MKNYSILFSVLFLAACSGEQELTQETNVSENSDSLVSTETWEDHLLYSENEQDTLLTNLATYIYRKPAEAHWDTKFEPRFRVYFIENRNNLELIYLHQNTDSSYYYYLLRDAQFKNGYIKRGVIGKFDMDSSLTLSNFEEIANTPAASDDKLKEIGLLFMNELVKTGNIEKYLGDKTKVEWPDGQLFYSKEKHEWRSVE